MKILERKYVSEDFVQKCLKRMGKFTKFPRKFRKMFQMLGDIFAEILKKPLANLMQLIENYGRK